MSDPFMKKISLVTRDKGETVVSEAVWASLQSDGAYKIENHPVTPLLGYGDLIRPHIESWEFEGEQYWRLQWDGEMNGWGDPSESGEPNAGNQAN